LILEGVKLIELLSPTPKGRITWAVPGWVDVEDVAAELVVVLLDAWVVVNEEDVVEVVKVVEVDEEDVVVAVLDVELAKVLVVEEADADVLELVVDEGWRSTLVANAPARRTSVTPAISTTVPSRPTR
jgi:hypothetical protein